MTQNQLDRAVASRTGESVQEIKRLGFSLADPSDVNFDPEPYDAPPQTIDWDLYELERNVALVEQPPRRRTVA